MLRYTCGRAGVQTAGSMRWLARRVARAAGADCGRVEPSLLVGPRGREGARGEGSSRLRAARAMEPGGIEPPSRDSQQDASTRVLDGFISVARPPSTASALTQLPEFSRPARPEAPRVGPARCLPSARYRASQADGVASIRPRERRDAQQLIFCTLFTRPACASTRHIKPSLPGRIQFGPSCQRAGNHRRGKREIGVRESRVGVRGGCA